jgi:hypothetical protein
MPRRGGEKLPTHRSPVGLLSLHQHSLDNHLRGDPCMVGAGLPENVAAVHPLIAAKNVLQRGVEGVAHVEIAGHIGRRDDDTKRLRSGAIGTPRAERSGFLPKRGNADLDRFGVKRFVHHGSCVRATPRCGGS